MNYLYNCIMVMYIGKRVVNMSGNNWLGFLFRRKINQNDGDAESYTSSGNEGADSDDFFTIHRKLNPEDGNRYLSTYADKHKNDCRSVREPNQAKEPFNDPEAEIATINSGCVIEEVVEISEEDQSLSKNNNQQVEVKLTEPSRERSDESRDNVLEQDMIGNIIGSRMRNTSSAQELDIVSGGDDNYASPRIVTSVGQEANKDREFAYSPDDLIEKQDLIKEDTVELELEKDESYLALDEDDTALFRERDINVVQEEVPPLVEEEAYMEGNLLGIKRQENNKKRRLRRSIIHVYKNIYDKNRRDILEGKHGMDKVIQKRKEQDNPNQITRKM